MRTPKENFLVSGKAPGWAKVIATHEEFETACEYALLQLQSEMLPNTMPNLPTDPYIGLDANAQMTGARRVLEILSTISEPIKPPKPQTKDTLHY